MSDAIRETTLDTVIHPQFIDGGTWMLVDHPTTRPLTEGAPDLGWEGDSRLAIYLHLEAQTFVLWRLEAHGEYLPIGHFGVGGEITPAAINDTIRRLIAGDSRRGADPYERVVKAQEKLERDAETDRVDALYDFADKLHFGLAHSHLPGVDITRPRQVLSRR